MAINVPALLPLLALAGGLFSIGGCGNAARDQGIADSAASIYEAAEAIKSGVPPELVVPAIQAQAFAITEAVGLPYKPAEQAMRPEKEGKQ